MKQQEYPSIDSILNNADIPVRADAGDFATKLNELEYILDTPKLHSSAYKLGDQYIDAQFNQLFSEEQVPTYAQMQKELARSIAQISTKKFSDFPIIPAYHVQNAYGNPKQLVSHASFLLHKYRNALSANCVDAQMSSQDHSAKEIIRQTLPSAEDYMTFWALQLDAKYLSSHNQPETKVKKGWFGLLSKQTPVNPSISAVSEEQFISEHQNLCTATTELYTNSQINAA